MLPDAQVPDVVDDQIEPLRRQALDLLRQVGDHDPGDDGTVQGHSDGQQQERRDGSPQGSVEAVVTGKGVQIADRPLGEGNRAPPAQVVAYGAQAQ